MADALPTEPTLTTPSDLVGVLGFALRHIHAEDGTEYALTSRGARGDRAIIEVARNGRTQHFSLWVSEA